MVIDRRKSLLYGSAAAVRLLLFFAFPSLPDLLTGRVEISTPVTSFKRCELIRLMKISSLTSAKCKKVFSSIPTMFLPTMVVSFTR